VNQLFPKANDLRPSLRILITLGSGADLPRAAAVARCRDLAMSRTLEVLGPATRTQLAATLLPQGVGPFAMRFRAGCGERVRGRDESAQGLDFRPAPEN